MRPFLAALLLIAASALAASAEEVVSPQEFQQFSEGYTLYFAHDGRAFGSESYGPDRRTRWRSSDGRCVRGVWEPRGGQVCFLYAMPGAKPLCWRVLRDEAGMFARLLDGPEAGMVLRITGRDKAPLLCGGPGQQVRAEVSAQPG